VTAGPGLLVPASGCDCRRCPFFTGNPLAPEPICSGCNPDCSYCGCSRAGGGAKCGQCPVRCGSRIDIGAWMADVGGTLSFDDLNGSTALPAGLPRFTPQVDGHDVPLLDADLGWSAYAIGLRRVLSPTTLEIYPKYRGGEAGAALGLGPRQLSVLVGYGEDPLVEAFWTRRRALIPRLLQQRWDLVLAPNYSMYGNQPRAEHLLNFRRNLLVAAEMAEAGIPAVPNIYWFRKEDLDRYLAWIADVECKAIAVNLQTFRTERDWEEMAMPGLTYLAGELSENIAIVLTGSSRTDRIRALCELFGSRLHLVSQNPLQYARHGAVMTSRGRVDRHAQVADLFAANVRFYAGLVEDAAHAREEAS
jgi:hypothetical protein